MSTMTLPDRDVPNAPSAVDLAIVIPAFKPDFLDRALESIAAQTHRGFRVYVGDDASPHDLRAICAPYAERMPLRYTRFASNLGANDLVAQWHRCIALSSEPWVWLFGDDDLMAPNAIEALFARIDADCSAYDLYHFDVDVIDASDRVVVETRRYPEVLPALEFALERARGTLSSYAPDYVFSRAALDACGGFEPFPLAWCSDDATWIKLGRRAGIRSVPGTTVRWRQSGQNISSASGHGRSKLRAACRYVDWLMDYLDREPPCANELSVETLRRELLRWVRMQAVYGHQRFWPRLGLDAAWGLRRLHRSGVVGSALQTLYWDVRFRLRGW